MTDIPANDAPFRLVHQVEFGADVIVQSFVNLYGCRIGDRTRIGPFVEIQSDVRVGADCKISSHTFICSGVQIDEEVFIGHGVVFVNDKHPRATTDSGRMQGPDDWSMLRTVVERRVSIGSGAVILGGVRLHEGALVGAGAVVTADVARGGIVVGNPARVTRHNP